MATVRTLKIAQVHRNPNQPREHFDQVALEELKNSILKYGLLQDIVVRPDNERGGYEIVAGERRYRAHVLAGKKTIRAKILSVAGELDQFKASMSENINREDMTPFEEARGFQRILDEEEGATVESVAADFSKSVQYVNMRLALLDLHPDVAQVVQDGHIGLLAGVKIAALNAANQRAVLGKFARGEFAGDNSIIHFAYAMRQQQEQPALLEAEELTEEQRTERLTAQKRTRNALDRIEQVRALLDDIARTDPMKLAEALTGGVQSRLDQLDRVADSLSKARFQMRQAKAHADAAQVVTVNPAAESDTATADDEARELVAA
ncbi:ParB/RepB/Spo0J family partition protein [Streptomyces olivoreticuli]|uniref:ParB/RepB/Spo0J family partition protein n=1 Tax=Streptomyces olivoreticuli TaxID=68246 RepID=UPI0013C2FC0D|nr:ParB/RepB/Spo0J family partition protein [Streptomyces olivoreticuli]